MHSITVVSRSPFRRRAIGSTLTAATVCAGLLFGSGCAPSVKQEPFASPGALQKQDNVRTIVVSDIDALSDWSRREFRAGTTYTTETADGRPALRGTTAAGATLLFRQQRIDLQHSSQLRWNWRIDDVYRIDDETTKSGDDFPARVYVAYQQGFLPADALVINYVWASQAAAGTSWPNPFAANTRMIVLRSGAENRLEWVSESRNLVADFKAEFGVDIDRIDGIGVMVDGDNSNQTGTAWFTDFQISP